VNDLTIRCMYSCVLCGLKKVAVEVPVRKDRDSVRYWLEQVASPVISADHAKRSPKCSPKKLSEVWIPMTGRPNVGGPVQN
jgi:hypothetical protein